jgi:hypothetical protein
MFGQADVHRVQNQKNKQFPRSSEEFFLGIAHSPGLSGSSFKLGKRPKGWQLTWPNEKVGLRLEVFQPVGGVATGHEDGINAGLPKLHCAQFQSKKWLRYIGTLATISQ